MLELGETFTLTASYQEHGIQGTEPSSPHEPVTSGRWWVDDPDIVRMPSEHRGEIEGVMAGTTTVWVEVGARRDSATVTVVDGEDGPSQRWKDVSTWATGTCALDDSGVAYCWGTDAFGELGNGPRRFATLTHRPVRVNAPTTFEQIERGSVFACARTAAGEVYCWGFHVGGVLGHGETSVDYEPEPVRVQFPGRATHLAVGDRHGCLLDEDNRAHCWGSNLGSQLGIEERVTNSRELGGRTVAVAFDGTFEDIAAGGYQTCGLTPERDLYCWGITDGGASDMGRENQLPSRIDAPTPPIHAPPGGGRCYLSDAGRLYCWGDSRLAPTGFHRSPTAAETELTFRDLSGICGLRDDRTAWCWGVADFDFFDPAEATEACHDGFGGRLCSSRPVQVTGDHRFETLSSGLATCGISVGGALYCWGSNAQGQLGIGRPQVESMHIPQRVLDPL